MNLEHLIIERHGMVVFYSFVALGFYLFLRSDRRPSARRWIAPLVIFIVTYIALVSSTWAVEHYIEWRLYSFDLDGNRSFDDSERVGELDYFFDVHVLDTARTFMPFTAVMYGGLAVGFAYALTLVRRGVGRLLQ